MAGGHGKRVSRISKGNKQCGSVTLSPLIAIVGAVCLLFFLTLIIISAANGERDGTLAVCGIFCLLGVIMILTLNWRIDYSPAGFVYRDMLRISHRYSYSQIKRIRYSKDIIIYVGRRIILIDNMSDNGRKFARIAAQYSKASFIDDSHSKLFGGNVASPEEFILAYIVIGLLPLGMALWAMTEFMEVDKESLTYASGAVSEYFFDKRDEDGGRRIKIKFEGIEGEFYSWRFDEENPEYGEFQRNAEMRCVYEFYYDPKDVISDGSAAIYEMSCGGRAFGTVEEYNENERETRRGIIVISAAILAVWLAYAAVSSYVMRNADKYPRLVRLFVKPEYIIKKTYNKHHKK